MSHTEVFALARPMGRIITVAIAVVAVAGGGFLVVRHFRSKSTSQAPQFFTTPVSVGPVAVTVEGTGSLAPQELVSVAPQVPGTVSLVKTTVGAHVRSGQPLFTMTDAQGLANQVTADRENLDNAENALENLVSPTIDQRTVEADRLQVQEAEVSLQQAEMSLKSSVTAVAPVDGTIQSTAVVVGQQVTAGETLATIAPSGLPTIIVPVPEAELPYLPEGTKAIATLPGTDGPLVPGTVSTIGTTASAAGAGSGATGPADATGAAAGTGSAAGGATAPRGTSVAASATAAAATACPDQSGSTVDVTVALAASSSALPAGGSVQVVFTPHGNPPLCDVWDATGVVTDPSTVSVSAGQAGTVTAILAAGSAVRSGANVATVLAQPKVPGQLSQAELAIKQDTFSLEQARLNLQATESPQPPTTGQLAAARLQVSQAETTLAEAEQNEAELTVTAPISGVVTTVSVAPDQVVGTGTGAVTIQSDGPLQAEVAIAETSIGQVKVGQQAQVTVDAYPDATYTGRVVSVAPAATTSSGPSSPGGSGVATFAVTVSLNSQQGLMAGMSDTVEIDVASAPAALRVPAQAVTVLSGDKGFVRVVGASGVPKTVPVTVGLVGQQYTQILSGLQPGEAVVAGEAATTTGGFAGGAGRFAFGGGGFAGGAGHFGGGAAAFFGRG